jgi:membrane protein implicated in regulation of membrane protease activity
MREPETSPAERSGSTSTWSEGAPVASLVVGAALILICIVLSFWVVFVALLIPVIVVIMAVAFFLGRRSTPDQPAADRDPAEAGYQGPEAEYGVESDSTTGDPAA